MRVGIGARAPLKFLTSPLLGCFSFSVDAGHDRRVVSVADKTSNGRKAPLEIAKRSIELVTCSHDMLAATVTEQFSDADSVRSRDRRRNLSRVA
jgi:hypothetical protein